MSEHQRTIPNVEGFVCERVSRGRLYASVSLDLWRLNANASPEACIAADVYLRQYVDRWAEAAQAKALPWPGRGKGLVAHSTGKEYWSISSVPKADASTVATELFAILLRPGALEPIRLAEKV